MYGVRLCTSLTIDGESIKDKKGGTKNDDV